MRLLVLTIRMITTAVSSHLEFMKQLNDFATSKLTATLELIAY